MEIEKKYINRDLVIETVLYLIEKKGGIKDVNLRGIAKEIGCAHTNLYNYFDSFNEIIWEALGQAVCKMMNYIESNVDPEAKEDEKIFLIFSAIIDFCIEHPGWFRLIWLEETAGKPSNEVIQILCAPGEVLKDELIKASSNELTEEKAVVIGDVLHTYIHGELCKWINNRSFTNSIEETKAKLLSNFTQLYRLLMNRG